MDHEITFRRKIHHAQNYTEIKMFVDGQLVGQFNADPKATQDAQDLLLFNWLYQHHWHRLQAHDKPMAYRLSFPGIHSTLAKMGLSLVKKWDADDGEIYRLYEKGMEIE